MAGSVTITPSSVSVVPGEQTTASVRIRNTGTVVDQFSVSVLGQAAAWTTAVPAVVSLFPGAEGTIDLHFAPPRTADVSAGPVPYGVRVDASQDADGSVVEEGEVDLLPFLDVQAKLTPRTSEAKKTARHEVLVDNRGNSPVEAEIVAMDPDEVLAFDVKPRTVSVPGGQSVHVPVKVVARKGFLKGTDKHRPFQVRVSYAATHPAITLDGTLVQKPGMPKFIVPLVGAAVVLALAALVLPAMKKDGASGKLSLTSEQAATTTTEAAAEEAPAEEPVDPNAPATAEEAAAAAAAEAAANGKDATPAPGGGGSSGGGGGTETASSGGGTPSAPTPPPGDNSRTEEEAPPATAVPAPPPSTTAPPPGVSTTTTAPQPIDMYYVIKQENEKQAHPHSIGDGTIGQTFRANGPIITEVWFNLSGSSVTPVIRLGKPGGPIVAQGPKTAIVSFGWTKIVLPKPAEVKPGEIYYLEGVVAGSVWSWFSNTNDYNDGDGSINGVPHGHDLNARVIGRTG